MKSKKLKIAIVSDAIYPYNKGGKEKRIYEISSRLAKAGHDVHIYCMKWWGGKSQIRTENSVQLHAISPLYPLYSGQRRSIKQAVLFSLSCFKLLREDFDVLEVDHMPHLVLFTTKLVSLIKKKKLYATWNEVWGRKYWVEYMGILGNIAFIIEWLSARLPDIIIAVSEHTKNKLLNDLKIKQEIVVVPNGIDLSLIQKVKPSKVKSDVIYAGRLLSHKNVSYVIDSISLLKSAYPNIKCIIVGKGPEEMKLKKQVDMLDLQKNIIFYDFLKKQEDLYALMKSSKVFAFPSTREGFGIAALEANAVGIPIITTNHQDNATKDLVINGKNGQIVSLNKKMIASSMVKLINIKQNKSIYRKISKAFVWDALAKKQIEVYKTAAFTKEKLT